MKFPEPKKHSGCCGGKLGHCICGEEEWNACLEACRKMNEQELRLMGLDEKELMNLITNYFPAFQGDIGEENKNELRRQIMKKFGRPEIIEKDIYDTLQEVHPHIINRKLAQSIAKLLEGRQ